MTRRAHPALWVPTLYFAMGTPMIAVSVVAAVMYKNLGLSNADIALYTGSMYLPWVLKPLWAPVVEMFGTKRAFVLGAELAMAATFGSVALALGTEHWLALSLTFLWVTGFASATQDIAADGVYIASMAPEEQARFVGIQGIFWNVGRLLASGVLVEATQYLHLGLGLSWHATWGTVMLALAGVMLVAALWHARVLPGGHVGPRRATAGAPLSSFFEAWRSFFAKPRILTMIAVVFFYRFGEGFIEKIGPLFMMDGQGAGGLGLDNAAIGRINGTYATFGFLAGTMLGGLFAARFTLRRTFWLLALALNVPHITYCYLAIARPESAALVATVVTIEKFGYGFGSVGHMLYMMQQVSPGRFRTAHYAFATGVMGLSMMATGMASGPLQQWLGYQQFFVWVLVASIAPVLFAWFAPFPHPDGEVAAGGESPGEQPVMAAGH